MKEMECPVVSEEKLVQLLRDIVEIPLQVLLAVVLLFGVVLLLKGRHRR